MSRRVIVAFGAGIAALAALHPPWTARAVVMRMSFDVPAAPPATVLDTVTWGVPFAAIYARPSLGIPAQQLAAYQARIARGDTSIAREWQSRVENIERRYRVPDTLRSKWARDTVGAVPAVAFTRRIVTEQFEVDLVRLGVYLLAVGAATTAAAIIGSRLSA
ncbi:MAG: hypothetical protein M3O61_06525 [Gemmatimonadota bacterium]|nr:hypothetical protein [Gemmatimonadota bacterium]